MAALCSMMSGRASSRPRSATSAARHPASVSSRRVRTAWRMASFVPKWWRRRVWLTPTASAICRMDRLWKPRVAKTVMASSTMAARRRSPLA